MRVAALDLGSNTFLLLIVDVENGKIIKTLCDEARVTRLGQGVHENRAFHKEALLRADQCFSEYRTIIDQYNVDHIIPVATSAARDVSNRDELFDIANKYDFSISVIPGWKEAEVSFKGSTFELENTEGVAIIDVGGGSTEIIGKNSEGKIIGCSVDVGSVRLTEMFVSSHPVKAEELIELKKYILEKFHEAKETLPNSQVNQVLAVAGTPTTLAAVIQKIEFEESRIHNFELSRAEINKWIDKLAQMSIAERVQLTGMQEKRADVIVAGAMILSAAAEFLNIEKVSVSTKGVRFGVAIEGESVREGSF